MNTEVLHLRARAGGAADHAALRQLATGWLAQLQPQDHGLPHDAIVLVRKLHVHNAAGPGPRGQAWRAGADKAWAHTLAGAAHVMPGQAVPAATTAVWFADPFELLLNLLHDLAQGTLAQAWWWPLALRCGSGAGSLTDGAWQHLQRHARQLPQALLQLPLAQAQAAWATGSRAQQQGLAQALVQHFGLHGAWFDRLQAPAALDAGDACVAAADGVALCRQIAIDPTPLRRAPAAAPASSADLLRTPDAVERTGLDQPTPVERMRFPADDTAAQALAAAASAGPGSRPAPRRVRERQAASRNAHQHIADAPRAIGAGPALRPGPATGVRHDGTGQGVGREALPAPALDPAPGATFQREPAPAPGPSTPASAPGRPPHPAPVPRCPPPASGTLHSRCAGLLLLLNAALAMGLYGDFSQPRRPGLPLHPWRWLWLAARQLHGPAAKEDPLTRWLRAAGGPQASAPAFAAWRPDAQTLEPWSQDTRPWVLLHGAQQPEVVLLHPAGFTVARLASADELPVLWTQLGLPPPPLLQRSRSRWHAPQDRPRDPLHDLWPCLWARLALALHDGAAPARHAKALARWATAQAGRVEISATRVRAVYTLGQWPLALRLAGLDRNPGWIPAAGCELVFDFE